MFGQDGYQGSRCKCSTFNGIVNCQQSCDGYFCALAAQEVTALLVGADPTTEIIDDRQCGTTGGGLHKWFQFEAQAGRMYQIATTQVYNGMTGVNLHVHTIDNAQTELITAAGWHCGGENFGDQLACTPFACTASGTYAVRVEQRVGHGPFAVQVTEIGSVEDTARAELMAPSIRPDENKIHFSFESSSGNFNVALEETWTAQIDVACGLAYCTFHRHLGSDERQLLTGDGENYVMPLEGFVGATYNFSFALDENAASASYIKIVISPVASQTLDTANAQGGAAAFDGNPDMSHEFIIGNWGSTPEGDQTYPQLNSDFYLKKYRFFPGEDNPTRAHWAWVAPADGDYYVTITSNCDVPLIDDAMTDAMTGAMTCESSWSVEMAVEDQTTVVTFPVITLHPSDCANVPGSDCQASTGSSGSQVGVPGAQNLFANVVFSAIDRDASERTMASCRESELGSEELCAQAASLFVSIGGNEHGHRRRTQRVSHDDFVQVAHYEATAPNREAAERSRQDMQLQSCLDNGIQIADCPGVDVSPATSNGRRLLAKLEVQSATNTAATGHHHTSHRLLAAAEERAARAEREVLELRAQLQEAARELEAMRDGFAM